MIKLQACANANRVAPWGLIDLHACSSLSFAHLAPTAMHQASLIGRPVVADELRQSHECGELMLCFAIRRYSVIRDIFKCLAAELTFCPAISRLSAMASRSALMRA